jgi:sialate O-acetylesterase
VNCRCKATLPDTSLAQSGPVYFPTTYLQTFLMLSILIALSSLTADVTLPAIFNDHMVLQRDKPLAFWGWADAGEEVTVSIGANKVTNKSDNMGGWKVKLPAMKHGGPHQVRIQGKNTLELKDVLVGEVWICSGQSNMEWSMGAVNNSGEEIKNAEYPNIRLFHVPKVPSAKPARDVNAIWKPCSPANVRGFSAVAYFFGRKLHKDLDIPIGLIGSSWGGTRIEPWTTPEGFAAVESLKDFLKPDPNSEERFRAMRKTFLHNIIKKIKEHVPQEKTEEDDLEVEAEEDELANLIPQPKDPQLGNARRMEKWMPLAEKALDANKPFPALKGGWPRGWPNLPPSSSAGAGTPTALYNGMVYPLVPFALRGAIWYQGESNLRDGMMYHEKMKALIAGWRHVWNDQAMPFLFTQLAPFRYGGSNPELLPRIWEAQNATLKVPHTGMAVITDIGNTRDIHPRNKQDVGARLALWALSQTYGKELVYSGPLYREMKVDRNRIKVSFDHSAGLTSSDGKELTHFQVAGKDGAFQDAKAVVEGNSISVSAPAVANPVAVRFGWHHEAEPNFVNGAGLPASPFRTDDWPLSE